MKRPARFPIRAAKVLALLRIVTALLFLEHGMMKLFHFPAAQPYVPDPLPIYILVAAFLELTGGILITLGLFTRVTAFLCSGEMAVGYFMTHGSRGFWPALNGGDAAILFCFVFLYLAAAGGGDWSVDRLRKVHRGEDQLSPTF
jgi:putative oxidoreductase